MDTYIKKIYDMLYSPIISPYNLLENAKLDNYDYVKYYKSDEGLIAEMKCVVPEEGVSIFHYYFDSKDYLQKISMTQNDITKVVYDRELEIEKSKSDYYENRMLIDKVI